MDAEKLKALNPGQPDEWFYFIETYKPESKFWRLTMFYIDHIRKKKHRIFSCNYDFQQNLKFAVFNYGGLSKSKRYFFEDNKLKKIISVDNDEASIEDFINIKMNDDDYQKIRYNHYQPATKNFIEYIYRNEQLIYCKIDDKLLYGKKEIRTKGIKILYELFREYMEKTVYDKNGNAILTQVYFKNRSQKKWILRELLRINYIYCNKDGKKQKIVEEKRYDQDDKLISFKQKTCLHKNHTEVKEFDPEGNMLSSYSEHNGIKKYIEIIDGQETQDEIKTKNFYNKEGLLSETITYRKSTLVIFGNTYSYNNKKQIIKIRNFEVINGKKNYSDTMVLQYLT